jgi:glycosyltransferase involved in cell wall biosynthesis/GT2 family glycosyltransferase
MTCSLLMLTCDQEATTLGALQSFEDLGWPAQLLVLDNGSGADAAAIRAAFAERLGNGAEDADLRVFSEGANLGATAGRNYLAARARTEWLLFVDNDVLFNSELLELLDELASTEADIVLPIVLSTEGDVWSAGGIYRPLLSWSSNGYFHAAVADARVDLSRAADWGPSCCLAMRRSVFEAVRGFDLGYGLYGSEDIDLCLRARKLGATSTRSATAPLTHLDQGTGKNWAAKLAVLRRTDARLRRQHGVAWARPLGALYWDLRRSQHFEGLRRLLGQPSATRPEPARPDPSGRGTVVGMPAAGPPRVLAWGALPPPVHGSSMVNTQVRDLLAEIGSVHWVNPATAGMSELGRVTPRKALLSIKPMAEFVFRSVVARRSTVYISVATSGPALYRDLLVWLVASLRSGRVIVHVHSGDLEGLKPKGALGRLKRVLIGRSEFWVLGSVFVAQMLEAGAPAVMVVPNGVACGSSHHGEPRVAGREEVRVVFLGHHFRTKGVDTIAELALALEGEPFIWAMAGSAIEADTEALLAPVVERLGTDRFRRIEHLDGDVRCRLLHESDVLLMPSRYPNEASPLVLIEAMEHGVVPIVSSRGCMPEVIGETGSVADTVEDLAHELRLLAKDRTALRRRSAACEQRWQDLYSAAAFEERVARLFTGVTNGPSERAVGEGTVEGEGSETE